MIKNKMNLKTIFFIIILISLLLPIISYGANITIGKYQIKNDKYITQVDGNIKVKDFKTNIGSDNIKIYENDKEITNVNQIIKTGMKVVIENKEYTAVVKGDSKGTGKASLTDLISILRHITAQNTERIKNKHPNWILKNENLEAIDFNGDGKIDLTDCISLQKSLLKPKDSNSGNTNTSTNTNTNTSNTTNNTNTNVTNKTEKEVTNITISKTNAELNIGKTLTLTARITPTNATNKSVTWSSSNEKVATVSSGKVTGISEGTATITVKSSNGKTATCEVKITPIEATSVRLSKTLATLYIGDTLELKATINPTNTTNKTITWSSDNPKIATVDGNGKVTVVGEGTATITVKTANGKTATCKITAKKKIINASTITLNQKSISLTEGQTLKLNATISPENTTDKTITWSSSNPKVTTVDNNGNIKAVSYGTARITAKTSNGKTTSANITVKKAIIEATKITLSKTSITLETGKSYTLKASITPSNVTNSTITWTSSNKKVATVNNGKVTAVGKGSATITAKTSNGKTATCSIKVQEALTQLSKKVVSNSSINILFIGNSKTYSGSTEGIVKNSTKPWVIKYFRGMATASGQKINKVSSITKGGATLLSTSKRSDVKNYINSTKWDYVILQEQTNAAYGKTSDYEKGVQNLVKIIKEKSPNAKIVYNSVWPKKKDLTSKNQLKIDSNAQKFASSSSTKGIVAYSGYSFLKAKNQFSLYRDDVHQNTTGAYLSSCSLYAAIFKNDPSKLSYYPSDVGSKDKCKKLQNIAWDAYKERTK